MRRCGTMLEISEEYIKKEKAKNTTAIKNYIAYFFIIMGVCTIFGGAFTYLTSMGTIISDISARVAMPYIIFGGLFSLLGLVILMIRTDS